MAAAARLSRAALHVMLSTGCASFRLPTSPRPLPALYPPCTARGRVSGLQSGLYTLLTPTLALAGASYLFAPGESLSQVFG